MIDAKLSRLQAKVHRKELDGSLDEELLFDQ